MGERYVAFLRLCWSSESADAWRRRTFFLNITRKRAELSPAPALCGTYLPVRSKERFGSRRTPCPRTFRKKNERSLSLSSKPLLHRLPTASDS